jgi:uncharacterized membrane protein YqjE
MAERQSTARAEADLDESRRPADAPLKVLFSDLMTEMSALVRGEVRLVQVEAEEKINQIQMSTVSILAGLVAAFLALVILLQAAVIALSSVMAPALASLIVGGLAAIAGWVLIWQGMKTVKEQNLKPHRTLRSLRATRDAFKGHEVRS